MEYPLKIPSTLIVSIAEPSIEAMIEASDEPRRRGCWAEFRLDALPVTTVTDLIAGCRRLAEVAEAAVFTLRPKEQGGTTELDLQARIDFWSVLLQEPVFAVHYLDWELDVAERFHRSGAAVPWGRVIVSEHRFDPGPVEFDPLFDRMAAFPGAVSKIVFTPARTADCAAAFSLLDRARSEGRRAIVIALGTKGAATRVLGPLFGAFATYASVSTHSTVAPGQIPFDEMLDRYRIHLIQKDFSITGLIGTPIGHSLSPPIHNAVYRERASSWVYVPFEVDELPLFIQRMIHPRTREVQWNFKGLSVTIPYKVAAVSLVDRLDELARRVGAVNTLRVTGDKLEGFNTDVAGIIEPLRRRLDPRGKQAIILGAGGAAAAACVALKDAGAYVRILSRNPRRAQELAARFGVHHGELAEVVGESYDILINATPVGMKGYSTQKFDPEFKPSPCSVIFDLVYNPVETPLLALARAQGCHTISGLEMLVEQAVLQHEIWTGEPADRDVMTQAALQALAARRDEGSHSSGSSSSPSSSPSSS